MMGPTEDSPREALFSAIFGGEEVSANLREILVNIVKRRGLGIPEPQISAQHDYRNSKAYSEVLVGSLLGGTNPNYVAHKGCIRRASTDGWKEQVFSDTVAMTRRKELVRGEGLNYLWGMTHRHTPST